MLNTIFAKKIEMKQWFNDKGRRLGVTVLSVLPMKVTSIRTHDLDGYNAVQFDVAGKRKREVRLEAADLSVFKVGDEIAWPDVVKLGDKVNVTGTSKGKGFAGVVKRHGFAGGPRTHGQSDRERAPGSIGSTTTPGRVLPGKKMAGNMGNATVTTQKLKVVEVDPGKQTILVDGAVPGAKQGLIKLTKI